MSGCATSSEVICVVVAQYPCLLSPLSFHIQVGQSLLRDSSQRLSTNSLTATFTDILGWISVFVILGIIGEIFCRHDHNKGHMCDMSLGDIIV